MQSIFPLLLGEKERRERRERREIVPPMSFNTKLQCPMSVFCFSDEEEDDSTVLLYLPVSPDMDELEEGYNADQVGRHQS